LFDIEFVVQWLQMRFGTDPRVRTSDTLDALGALHAGGYVSRKAFDVLRDAYLFLRRLEQRIRIVHGSGSPVIDASGPGLDKLARRVGIRRSPHESEGPLLLEAYRDVTERVRATYLELMGVN
jgi:glutamate-ammonia-ligase adenylyltransferase